jgi:hypothetical protein
MASSVLSMSLSASLAGKSKVFSSKTNKSISSNRKVSKITTTVRATGTMVDDKTGIKKMRDGIKEAADENLLTPRFYTTGTRLYYYLISCLLLCLLLLLRSDEDERRLRIQDIFVSFGWKNGISFFFSLFREIARK